MFSLFVVFFLVTESAEKPGNFEQAYERWLFVYVHAFSCYRDRDSGCRHIPTDQILVIPTTTAKKHNKLACKLVV